MAVPVYSVGQVWGAADVNNWALPAATYKTSDTSRASNTTLSADPDLTIAVAANAVYDLRMYIGVTGAAPGSGDLQVQFTAPASAAMQAQAVFLSTAGVVGISGQVGLSSVTFGANTSQTAVFLEGTFTTAATSGSLTLTWAQHTSSGTATVVKAGSKLILQRVG